MRAFVRVVVVGLCLAVTSPLLAQDILDIIQPSNADEEAGEGEQEGPAPAEKEKESNFEWLPRDFELRKEAGEGPSIWEQFFERDPIGFTFDTFANMEADVVGLWPAFLTWWSDLQAEPLKTLLTSLLPLWIFFALVVLQIVVSLKLRELTPTVQAWLDDKTPPWVRWIAGLVLPSFMLVLAPSVILFVVYLGSGVVPETYVVWTLIFKGFYIHLIVYRALLGATRGVLENPQIADPRRVRRLKNLVTTGLRIILVFMIGTFLVDATDYRGGSDGEIYGLIVFCLKATVGVVAVRLFVLKTEFLALIERVTETAIGQRIRRYFDQYYGWVVGVSIVLMFLWSVGYTHAAVLLLTRGYAILGVLAAAAAIDRQGRLFIKRRSEADSDSVSALQRLERALGGIIVLVTGYLVLWLLGLQGYLLALLQYPLLRLGKAELSVYTIGKAAIIVTVFIIIGRVIRPLLNRKVYPRFGIDIGVGYAINTVTSYFLIVLGVLTGLVALGVDLGAMTVVFGALSVGIGFGLQNITQNLISGFILLFGRSVKKGDLVAVGDITGRVEALGARAVHLITPDNHEIVIPSSALVSDRIINFTYSSPLVRVHVPVGVGYGSDMRLVERALHAAAARHPDVQPEPPVSVWLTDFGDNSVNFALLVWIDVRQTTPAKIKGELNFHIWDVLAEQRIEIPFPQRDVHIKTTDVVENIARALHDMKPVQREPEEDPPPLPPIPQRGRRVGFHQPDMVIENAVIGRLRAARDPAARRREIRRAVESFVTSRLASVEDLAATIVVGLNAYRDKHRDPAPSPIDELGPDLSHVLGPESGPLEGEDTRTGEQTDPIKSAGSPGERDGEG